MYFAKCIDNHITAFVMQMLLPRKPQTQNLMIVTVYGWICDLAESVFSAVSYV